MALKNQVHIYNLDTSAFYNEKEQKIHSKMSRNYSFRWKLKFLCSSKKTPDDIKNKCDRYIANTSKRIQRYKHKLELEFDNNFDVRVLNYKYMKPSNVISVFESSLTRTISIPTNALSLDFMVIRTYFFQVLKDLVCDGFMYNGEKYVFFTASAGQIRTKKCVFIKESVFEKHRNTLMCGLSEDQINSLGGVNINKYLAYLALCNSATDKWEDFDIDKAIVVEDMETLVNGVVDFIDDSDYSITRTKMDVPIPHTDGCGMILPGKCKRNRMVRLPWIKGLLSPMPFDKFIERANHNNLEKNCGLVTDIYGKQWDILNDGIEVIFTKSQFKMHKFYANITNFEDKVVKYGWDIYKENFKRYNCEAGYCNEEEDVFDNAKLGYQMLQTLTDITDEELEHLCRRTVKHIQNIGYDRTTMLKVLGVTKGNTQKNYLQQAIEIYPELLNDTYCHAILKQVKRSLVKEGRAGKIDINGKYTFIIPDLYAFCEYLFLGEQTPEGFLENQEVFCKLYKDVDHLDCLRSPHLYREHAVRKNRVDDEKSKWFITNGLYTSCHDLISKILQFDVDGDHSLVIADKEFVEVAQRNMDDIVPLYYKMKKAGVELISSQSKYKGITTAYKGGNIGMISNNITKIWNSEDINLDCIKLLCMENNYTIDFAKTLYKPERPNHINKKLKQYTNKKVPHFFIYAKDKDSKNVNTINKSVINRLHKIIPNPIINFKAVGLNNFNFKMLMDEKHIDISTDSAQAIIEKYTELDLKKRFIPIENDDDDSNDVIYLYIDIRNQILHINSNINYVVDVLVEYLYGHKHSKFKTTLWSSFGDIIVENLKFNIVMDQTYCEICGDLVEKITNNQKYCDECANDIHKKSKRDTWHKNKNKYRC